MFPDAERVGEPDAEFERVTSLILHNSHNRPRFLHLLWALFRTYQKHRLKDGKAAMENLARRSHLSGIEGSKTPGIIGRNVEFPRPKPAVYAGFPVLHRRKGLLPKMVPCKVKKIQHIVVPA